MQKALETNINREMSSFTPVTHVIFDIDGLLLDTERILYEIFSSIAEKYGKKYSWELKEKLIGRTEKDSAKIFIEGTGVPLTVEEFHTMQKEMENVRLIDCEPMPGASRLVMHLHDNSIPIALATSSTIESVHQKFARHKDLFKYFHHIVSASSDPEVKSGKPAPDIFLVCASRFPEKPKPEECLVFEDAPSGVLGGKSAGMQTVMVPDPQLNKDLTKNATIVLKSLEDFEPELFNLPPFKGK